MKTINLRDYYPFYTQDTLLEVSDIVAEALAEAERQERNYLRRIFYNKAHYSLDAEDGIENAVEVAEMECHILTPEAALNLMEQNCRICRALLPAGHTGPPDRSALLFRQEPKGNCRRRGRCQKLGERKHQERIDSYAGIFERKLSASTELNPSYSHGI